MSARANSDPLAPFHPAVRDWFHASFDGPTTPQTRGWPAIARGESTLILAPTGSGKTLTAFLWCLHRLMFTPAPSKSRRCRVLYISPLKALAVDVERNLRAPLAGIARVAADRGDEFRAPSIAIRTGDTPAQDRARFLRDPADILITTPESLYLLLTSNARDTLRGIDTVIIDEIHALVPTKRGAHLALSLERLTARCDGPPQRIGLSATQRPLDEVARFLGGATVSRNHADASASRSGKKPRAVAHARRGTAVRKSAVVSTQATAEQSMDSAVAGDEFLAAPSTLLYRPITIVDAGARKQLKLQIEVPVEDMARLPVPARVVEPGGVSVLEAAGLSRSAAHPAAGASATTRAGDAAVSDDLDDEVPSGPASATAARPSIWSAIHPRLLELIRAHQSTLIFVNSRRLAERLAGALNEMAGEVLVRSHHGSIAREQRVEIEDRLKAGTLRALVATSSLELGIDMGAIDLVIQIEAPPSVASGLQRIGRGGHQINAVSEGVIFPKFRGDLVACAAVARAMHDGAVEATRYPRNPLDVVAQQIVAMAAVDTWDVDELFDTIRGAAPCAELSRGVFDGVLDMLSGRYPSDEFAELRPRITWDRVAGTIVARDGAKRVAIANGGTIPDRGLYGVFLIGAGPGAARVGELDEEMVFETHAGETFVLGASTWRVEEITHDRVLVSPAPGEPGKMPFWKGDRAGRPLELGLAIGQLMHDLMRLPPAAALERLTRQHDLDALAAENLLQYLRDQMQAARALPDASTIVIERVRDELGDWRVCVLSPRGGRVHAPWAMAAAARIREETGVDVETLWGDDGFVVRFPDVDTPPDPTLLLPGPEDVQALVVGQLGSTALFAAKFRENAGRSLLLPKRRPGMRAPLWQQRKRASDLLAVASRFGSFPVLLETYRECLRDYFDMPALVQTLGDVQRRKIRVATVDSEEPSPFAASLLFSYVASFLYDGDAPLAERRAQALAVDQAQLRELMGDAELRELLDAEAVEAVERQLQRLDPKFHARTVDAVHDMLLALGDLSEQDIAARTSTPEARGAGNVLVRARRAVVIRVAGQARYVAVEDAARFRDALGIPLPPGVPESLLVPVRDPIGDLALRYARTHSPFTAADFAAAYGVSADAAERHLVRLTSENRLLEGEFNPGGTRREWTDANVLRMIRRRSLAKLRKEVEPVDQTALGRFVGAWQGLSKKRRGADALLDVIEQLQGAPLPASILETDILASRLDPYEPADLDAVIAAGEVVWVGIEPLGERDGRVALFLTDQVARLLPRHREASRSGPPARGSAKAAASAGTTQTGAPPEREQQILEYLTAHGASFFAALHEATGGGYPADTVAALWNLAWQGLVTNDTAHVLRAFTHVRAASRKRPNRDAVVFRSRRQVPASAEGRWSLVPSAQEPTDAPARGTIAARAKSQRETTTWAAATTQQLLNRYGVLTREAVAAESVPGGYGVIYTVLKAMEESGRIRRGYFVSGLGATQFALPGALDVLRSYRDPADDPIVISLAATDPANPYGATLKWPTSAVSPRGSGWADSEGATSARRGRRAPSKPDVDSARRSASSLAEAGSTLVPHDAATFGRGPTRTVGATVILVDGALAAYLARGDRQLLTWIPDAEPLRSRVARSVAHVLIERARSGGDTPRGMLLETIDGLPAQLHPLLSHFIDAGFAAGAMGLQGIARGRS
ncbi:MAG: DEAD/DEAH box helicase [Vicinamibacterales bacterium]